mgnify:CR=1 FL=1|jgi:hypothetical protein
MATLFLSKQEDVAMGKKAKVPEASAEIRNWIPGWIGGVTSPIVQQTARERMREKVIAFESRRRAGEKLEDADCPIFRR